MKKTLFIMGAAALALVACNKSQTVETVEQNELSFKAVAANATKAGELASVSLPSNYGIYAGVTQRNFSNAIENPNFFGTEQLFGFESTSSPQPEDGAGKIWHAGEWNSGSVASANNGFTASPIYWPIGGVRLDFLSYSLPFEKHSTTDGEWKVVWPTGTNPIANGFTVNAVDTYTNQVDFMFAAANGQTSQQNADYDGSHSSQSVALTFKHAQALLIFNVRASVASKIQIDEIAFLRNSRVQELQEANRTGSAADAEEAADVTLKTVGTLTVDNSRNELTAKWSYSSGATVADHGKMKTTGTEKSDANNDPSVEGFVNYGAPITQVNAGKYDQLGETLLIPEQEKVNFTIKYQVGGKTAYYTYNDLRGVWEMGKKYIYNIDINLAEIVITEDVAPYAPGFSGTDGDVVLN